jgi:hypothetical protein
MTDVSTFRLYLMRALYLLIFVGLGSEIWPLMFHHAHWDVMHGVACSLLAALSAMMALGIRYPLQMLPLLLFELLWKTIWLIAIALPLWSAHQIDADTGETVFACLMGVVLCPIAIPWPYAFANYVKKPGDRWKGAPRGTPDIRP